LSYPVNLDICGKICVVIGGGHVAFRKITGLLNAGGKVIVIAPEVCDDIKKLSENHKIEWWKQKYFSGCLPEGLILIAAANDEKINEQAANEAAKKHMLVNVVNKKITGINTFNVPSVIRKKNFMLTISTEGLSPAFSKYIRQKLETQFNDNFAEWLFKLSKIRDEVKNIIKDANIREEFWQNVMSDENYYLVQNGELEKAEVNIKNVLDGYRCKSQNCTD